MATIGEFYNHISSQVGSGTIVFNKMEPYNLSFLLDRLKLDSIRLTEPSLSVMSIENSFRLTGNFTENGRFYHAELLVTQNGNGFHCSFTASLMMDGEEGLNEWYPPAMARLVESGYSELLDMFQYTFVTGVDIFADTKSKEKEAGISLAVYYTEECPVYRRYGYLVPPANQVFTFSGNAYAPFAQTHYTVRTSYVGEVTLPFSGGDITVKSMVLELKSHVEDVYDFSYYQDEVSETKYICALTFQALVPLPIPKQEGVWLFYNLFDHGQSFFISADFGEDGLSVGDAVNLVASLSGRNEMVDFPDWLGLNNLSLLGLVFKMEKEVSNEGPPDLDVVRYVSTPAVDGLFNGCAIHFALPLPSLPIPFFDKEDGGAQIRLIIQWDMLDFDPSLAVIVGFFAVWKGYRVLINIELPSLSFEGRIGRYEGDALPDSSLFPGFANLSLEDLRIAGSIPDNRYTLDFQFSQEGAPGIPIGRSLFQVDYISGSASYSPTGLSLELEMEITILNVVLALFGKYEKEGDGQVLTLGGGLAKELSLAELIGLITGTPVDSKAFDFIVKQLYVKYVTVLSDSGTNGLGTPREFSFLCGIEFDWGVSNRIGSTFDLHWDERGYAFKVSAEILLFEILSFAASCTVVIENGSAVFKNYEFRSKIRDFELLATFEKDKRLTFTITNFNLGKLLEALISLIDPDHNWYLPWPFTVLRQIHIKELIFILDHEKKTMQARYRIDFKILFLTVQSIELFYDRNNGDFMVNVEVSGGVGGTERINAGERNRGNVGKGESFGDNDVLGLNLLKNTFPVIKGISNQLFEVKYLAVGQHIRVEIPTNFDETQFPTVLERMKKSIKKEGRPVLDANNNWVAALQIKLIQSIDITVLMCDPNFYGAEIAIGKGSEITERLAGLKFTILYSKVTETIGMFYARLTFPEVFRNIELGAVQVRLGEIALSIYTNGNFKIDMGFPYNKDFSRSFGLTYLIFSGRGGFYFGLLNGDTSKSVPKVSRGHFETVVELGVGLSVGVGREFSFGPLKAGAYIRLVAIFQGVFATYVPENKNLPNSSYYLIKATAGVTAAVYGSVDFVLVKVGFSINLSFMADVTIERYRKTLLSIDLDISVKAYIKIWLIKINFSFRFHWSDHIELGKSEVAPWELPYAEKLRNARNREYELTWYDEAVFPTKRELYAEIVPFFTYDGAAFDEEDSGKRKIAFLSLLHGYDGDTRKVKRYKQVESTPFPILIEGLLRRLFQSVTVDGDSVKMVTMELLLWLKEVLSGVDAFRNGFRMERVERFLNHNLNLNYMKGENVTDEEIMGVPFPLPPFVVLEWFSAPDDVQTFDLSLDPIVDEDFMERMEEYYEELSIGVRGDAFRFDNKMGQSASTYLFTQYFYMLTRITVSVAISELLEDYGGEGVDDFIAFVISESVIQKISGMTARFSYGGLRAVTDNAFHTEGLYSYARQQMDGLSKEAVDALPDDMVIHKMTMHFKEAFSLGARLFAGRYYNVRKSRDAILEADFYQNKIDWEFRKRDLAYPEGRLTFTHQPILKPFYYYKPKTLELKNPKRVCGKPDVTFLEAEAALPEPMVIRMDVNAPSASDYNTEVLHQCGFLIYLTVNRAAEGVYTIGSVGYDDISRLTRLKKSEITGMELYRLTTTFDEEDCGLYPLDGEGVFLYRANLSLEAEKPELIRRSLLKRYGNSAYLSDYREFVGLLYDASLVNAKGYYLRFDVKGDFALENGEATLALWVECRDGADAVKLFTPYDGDREKPTVVTDSYTPIYAYDVGTLAFELKETEADCSLMEAFQMLQYQVKENAYFRDSNESRPLIAQEGEGKTVFSQVIPAYRFAMGEGGGPYRGIQPNSQLHVAFSRLDVLGNRSREGTRLAVDYGYSDPLVAPTAYPHTKCVYGMEENAGGGYDFILTFSYMDEAGDGDVKKLVEEAYWQLMCEDVTFHVKILGTEYPLELQPIRNYVGTLYQGGEPEEIGYRIKGIAVVEQYREVNVALVLRRSEKLLAKQLVGSNEANAVLLVESAVCEGDVAFGFLARRGSDGKVFIVKPLIPRFIDAEAWTLPPLCNKKIGFNGVLLKNMDGTEVNVSFSDIDIQVWADVFLSDFEGFIAPASVYAKDRDTLEGLLTIKKELAGKIANAVIPITGSGIGSYAAPAREYLANEMWKNLSLGSSIDAVILAKTMLMPDENSALLCGVKLEGEDAAIRTAKIKRDGILAMGVKVPDVSKKMKLDLSFELSVTDIEYYDNLNYHYLTFQKSVRTAYRHSLLLPYKRYPEVPKLMEHSCGEGEVRKGDYFKWDYKFSFSHNVAEQDLVKIRLALRNGDQMRRSAVWRLPDALAQYVYLRDAFVTSDGESGEERGRLLETCYNILDAWAYKPKLETYRAAYSLSMVFRMEIGERRLYFQNAYALDVGFSISMMNAGGEWVELAKEADGVYALPDEEWLIPFVFEFSFKGFNIKEVNVINAYMSVTRNQGIEGVNPAFVYGTDEVCFTEELTPFIKRTDVIQFAAFTEQGFAKELTELADGFGNVSLEVYYKSSLGNQGGDTLYSFIPVFYVPAIARMEEMAKRLYHDVMDWVRDNMGTLREGDGIRVYASFYDSYDKKRNLVEFTALEWEIQASSIS